MGDKRATKGHDYVGKKFKGNLWKFLEPGKDDNVEDDPYAISSPENVMKYLKGEEYIEVRNE